MMLAFSARSGISARMRSEGINRAPVGLLPPPRACSVSYNYAWEYFRRQQDCWYILSRDACRDCHKASSCGAVT